MLKLGSFRDRVRKKRDSVTLLNDQYCEKKQ